MIDSEIQAMIKNHEGYRKDIYIDTVGVPTGGYGHAFHMGSQLPDAVWEFIFRHDFAVCLKDYEVLSLDIDTVRRAVIIDMLFNLGLSKLLRFKNMLSAIRNGDFETAARSMEDSKWFGQVGQRAVKLVQMMRTGKK